MPAGGPGRRPPPARRAYLVGADLPGRSPRGSRARRPADSSRRARSRRRAAPTSPAAAREASTGAEQQDPAAAVLQHHPDARPLQVVAELGIGRRRLWLRLACQSLGRPPGGGVPAAAAAQEVGRVLSRPRPMVDSGDRAVPQDLAQPGHADPDQVVPGRQRPAPRPAPARRTRRAGRAPRCRPWPAPPGRRRSGCGGRCRGAARAGRPR